jgi:putative ABC transport system ATP-binding protein
MDQPDSLRWLRVVPDPSQVLVARRLHRRLGPEQSLTGISVTVNRGECLTVIGPGGSGKTALLAILCGLDEPDSGSVSVAGHLLSYQS